VTKDNLPSLRKLFRTSLASVLAVAVPAFGLVAVASDAVIDVLLGSKWSAAAILLPPVALAMIPHMISSITGSMLSGRGDQKIELASQALTAALLFLAYFALPLNSLLAVAWLFCGLYCLRAVFLLKTAMQRIQLDGRIVVSVVRGPVIVTGIGSALYSVVASFEFLSPQSLLAIGVILFVTAELLLVLLFPRALVDQSIFDLLTRYREKHVLLDWFLTRVNNKIAPVT
jgi:O-antigen/teichoic acid export membrane protein